MSVRTLHAETSHALRIAGCDGDMKIMDLCKQHEHNNSHLKFILDNTIFVWLSWFEINWLFCFCCFLFRKYISRSGRSRNWRRST